MPNPIRTSSWLYDVSWHMKPLALLVTEEARARIAELLSSYAPGSSIKKGLLANGLVTYRLCYTAVSGQVTDWHRLFSAEREAAEQPSPSSHRHSVTVACG